MRNKAPILVNGFARGGSNIFMNLIASHPDVCILDGGETHMVFLGRRTDPVEKWARRALYLPVWMSVRQHVFGPWRLYERRRLPRYIMPYVDLMLYRSKVANPDNRFLADGVRRSKEEIEKSRLLAKNLNGVVLATDTLAEVYPDAHFVGLVRNGLAMCEGYVRRGFTVSRFAAIYSRICEKMAADCQRMSNYTLVRFEDMIADPVGTAQMVYERAGLDVSKVSKYRLQAKASMTQQGQRQYTFGEYDREVRWFPPEELVRYFRKDVNENQIARLGEEDKRAFLKEAHRWMRHFGYLDGPQHGNGPERGRSE